MCGVVRCTPAGGAHDAAVHVVSHSGVSYRRPGVVTDTLCRLTTVSRTAIAPTVHGLRRLIQLLVCATVTCVRCGGQNRQVLQGLDDVEVDCSVACPGTEVASLVERLLSQCGNAVLMMTCVHLDGRRMRA